MPTPLFVMLVLLLWLLSGLGAALVFLGRQGHRSRAWYLVGAVLGPLFVPIAMERGHTAGGTLERLPDEGGSATTSVTVLVGVDGSAESDEAVRSAASLFGAGRTRFVLVGVADADMAEFPDAARLQEWRDLLAERARWLPAAGSTPVLEVLCGQPAHALLGAARDEGADVVVIGRRGRGVAHQLLGSVAANLTGRCPVPVLLAGPAGPRTGVLREGRRGELRGDPGAPPDIGIG